MHQSTEIDEGAKNGAGAENDAAQKQISKQKSAGRDRYRIRLEPKRIRAQNEMRAKKKMRAQKQISKQKSAGNDRYRID